jgi:hypothetical protein
MKANEIMIDDWVYNKGIDKPMQVYPTMLAQMFGRTPDAETEDYNIFPIPLTSEILAKNGFEHEVTEEDSDNFDGAQGDLCYVFNKTPEGYMSCVDVTHSFTITGRIRYVHELQHILRLRGIEKEIVI